MLLKLKTMAISGHEKHLKDVMLLSKYFIKQQEKLRPSIQKENQEFLDEL